MCSTNTFHYCLCPLIRKKAIWSRGHNCFHWSCCLECPAQCLRVEITVADSTLILFFFTELDQECWSECLNARPFKNIFPFSFQLRMETWHSSCQWDINQSLVRLSRKTLFSRHINFLFTIFCFFLPKMQAWRWNYGSHGVPMRKSNA